MNLYEISLIFVPPICAFVGFLGKYILDKRRIYIEKVNNKKLENIEIKLKNFYYPIHNNLIRENIIWNKILTFYRSMDKNDMISKIFWELDKEMLNIHLENQNIIKEQFVEMHIEENLAKLLMDYDEHVTIYNIIRKIDNDKEMDMNNVKWPASFGSKYPYELLELIESQLNILKKQQQELIYCVV
jgi:hypothetical protein